MNFSQFSARTYIGKDKYGNTKTVQIIRKTPQYIYYMIDTDETGRAKLQTDCYGECIKITKYSDLYISAANPFN